jgi:HprK-related kinase B
VDGLRVIFKKRTGVVHYVRSDTFFAVGDLEKHPQQLLNLVATAFGCWLRREGYVALHASAVSADGLAIVFAGNSGSGKSSAALAMMNQGFDFVSNDRVFLRRTDGLVEVVGVPKWPRVNPGTLMANPKLRGILAADRHDLYSQLSAEELWELEHKHDVFVTTVYGKNRVSLRAFLKSLYVITWRHGRGPANAEAVHGSDVGRLLMPMVKTEVYEMRSSALPGEDDLSALLAGHPVVHISGGVDMARLLDVAQGTTPVA